MLGTASTEPVTQFARVLDVPEHEIRPQADGEASTIG